MSRLLLFQLLLSQKTRLIMKKWCCRLRKMMQEDPSFQFTYDEETGQTVILVWVSCILKLLLIV